MKAARRLRALPLGWITHPAVAAGAFVAIVGAVIGGVAIFGDPNAAAPRRIVGFSANPDRAPVIGMSEAAVDPSAVTHEDAGFFNGDAPAGDAAAPTTPPDGSQDDAAGADGKVKISVVQSGDGKVKTRRPPSPLPKAPLAGLFEKGADGLLPIVAKDGRTPGRAYARPFVGDASKPKIALVLGGLGVNAQLTQSAIDDLPPEITLSFVPYAADLQSWIDKARAAGHEALLELPMEPYDLQADDTGPQTLLAAGPAKDNIDRLNAVLSAAAGYFGVVNYQGARFAASGQASGPVAQALKARGLTFLGNGLGARTAFAVEAGRAGLPFTSVDRIIDGRRDAEAIDEQLLNLEALALERGAALGSGFAYPVTIDQIESWAENLSMRGYVLAPASTVMDGRAGRR